MSAFSGTTAKPSLGPTFSYLVDATLWLTKANQVLDTDKEDLYIAEVLKSRRAVGVIVTSILDCSSSFCVGYRLVFPWVHRWGVQKCRT